MKMDSISADLQKLTDSVCFSSFSSYIKDKNMIHFTHNLRINSTNLIPGPPPNPPKSALNPTCPCCLSFRGWQRRHYILLSTTSTENTPCSNLTFSFNFITHITGLELFRLVLPTSHCQVKIKINQSLQMYFK